MATQLEIESGTFDFSGPVRVDAIPEGRLVKGVSGEEQIIMLRRGDKISAWSGTCTHLGAPLADGLLVGHKLRCPWHQACFDLDTGEAIAAPAFAPLAAWSPRVRDGQLTLEKQQPASASGKRQGGKANNSFLIIGGGAAGFAAADMLCREGVESGVTMVSQDVSPPYERTVLTKEYLDGSSNDPRLNLGAEPLDQRGVKIELSAAIARIDIGRHVAVLSDGRELPYEKLLLATGGEPRRPDFPGADLPRVHVLRSLADCRSIIEAAQSARRVVVLGASFIGLEAGASLRDRGLEVDIVSQETAPMERIFGPEIATAIVGVHRKHGVRLHLGRKIASFDGESVTLDDGARLRADIVLIGIGVQARIDLAQAAGLAIDDGILVDRFLQTNAQDVFAAGDIANWPDIHSGSRLRVEHWNVAARQGQVAARNMLGRAAPFTDVPFFWTKQFDFSLSYVGHANEWDEIKIDGDISKQDCAVRYIRRGQVMAAAMIGRDAECLAERESMERAAGA
jgi:NADPH-dependent 2,4-dienoyl-CoA reductase/sulfur reductase-like enzyme/nitrite reductase/ring-hydroxylating ferredoxin subunit